MYLANYPSQDSPTVFTDEPIKSRNLQMKKILAAVVAMMFAVSTGAFSAAHAKADGKDAKKEDAKKEAKKDDMKKDAKK